MSNDFGKRLRLARQHAGLTQEQAAARVKRMSDVQGIAQSEWRRYEAGQVIPSALMAARLAGAVDTDLEYLVYGRRKKNSDGRLTA